MTAAATLLALCRFAGDAAALSLWGGWAFLAWLAPAGLAAAVGRGLTRATGTAVAAAALAAALKLPALAATVGDGWRDAADPAFVAALVCDTGPGRAWGVQAAAAALLLAARRAPPRLRPGATALAAGLSLAGLALTGHAAMHDGALGLLHRALGVLHALSAGAWVGALIPVLAILRGLDRRDGRVVERAEAALALRRFSRAGHAAVALVVASGAAEVYLVLGRWPLDPRQPYEALLDAKVLAVGAMVALALVNRYALVPRLGRGAMPALRRATLAEIPLGAAAIALVAVFGQLDPG